MFVPSKGGELVPLGFDDAYERQTVDGSDRLVVSVAGDGLRLLRELAFSLGEELVCRYEEREEDLRLVTRPLSHAEVDALLNEYSGYLASDPRHNFSLKSPSVTVVLDEHNFLLVYGDTERVARILAGRGFVERPVALPTPHVHRDQADMDSEAARLRSRLAELGR